MKFLTLMMTVGFMCAGCGATSTSDKSKSNLAGWRYAVKYTRAADLDVWVPVKGSLEFWFFQAGIFRQVGADYIEPQFFDSLQACNGAASGTFTIGESTKSGDRVPLAYDGVAKDTRGQCRMAPRDLFVTIQPSGVVDILDDKVAIRLERVEPLL